MKELLLNRVQKSMLIETQAFEYFNASSLDELINNHKWEDPFSSSYGWLGGVFSFNINFITASHETLLVKMNWNDEINKIERILQQQFPTLLETLLNGLEGWEIGLDCPLHWEIENYFSNELTDLSYLALSYILSALLYESVASFKYKLLDFSQLTTSQIRLFTDSVEARAAFHYRTMYDTPVEKYPASIKEKLSKSLASANAKKRNKPLDNIKQDLEKHLRQLKISEANSARALAKELLPLVRKLDKSYRYGLSADDIQARETIAKWVRKFKKHGSVL